MADATYAVFLSYNSEDHEIVEKLAVYLDDCAKLRPWLDRWSLVPGEPWVRNLENGLISSDTCAVFIGRSGEGPWQKPEVETALREQVKRPGFRVIPVLLPGASSKPELPPFLSGQMWVDLQKGLDDDDALWRLECGIQGIPPGRGRPAKPAAQAERPIEPMPPAPAVIDQIRPARTVARFFISYRHEERDQAIAHAFAEALKRAGHKVFIDTDLRWGADWVRGIREELDECDYLLLLLSHEAARSEMVAEEVAVARDLAMQRNGAPTLLPVRVRYPFDEPLPYHLSAYLRSIQQEKWETPDDTQRLICKLLSIVEGDRNWADRSTETVPEGAARSAAPAPSFDPRGLIVPGGGLETNSRFYIYRTADEEAFFAITRPRGLVTVRGPRQTGKTSLIMRAYASFRQTLGSQEDRRLRAAFVDFMALPDRSLESLDAVWRSIGEHIAAQLRIDEWDTSGWNPSIGYDRNLSRLLDRFVFDRADTDLVICLDEVDRVFGSPVKSEFFSAVRAFFNRGAYDPSWGKVRWLLSTSSEPALFIEDLMQSPFNVGAKVELGAFSPDEVATFAERHGLSLDPPLLDRIMDYIGGQPFLVHLMLYHMARRSRPLDELFDTRRTSAKGGIFRDHVHRFLLHFQRDERLSRAMTDIIQGKGCGDRWLVDRLEGAGLVRWDAERQIRPLCRLYAEFFGSELH